MIMICIKFQPDNSLGYNNDRRVSNEIGLLDSNSIEKLTFVKLLLVLGEYSVFLLQLRVLVGARLTGWPLVRLISSVLITKREPG